MIVVGLGNPGQQYADTRHNVGFMVLDAFARSWPDLSWKTEFGVSWARLDRHWLLKPQEFMNLSGPTLNAFLQKKGLAYSIERDLLVIHDDLDFPLGEIHAQADRSAAGHQGVQSLVAALGSQAFRRLRIGIGNNREVNVPAEAYVLQKFSAEEAPIISQAVSNAVQQLKALLTE